MKNKNPRITTWSGRQHRKHTLSQFPGRSGVRFQRSQVNGMSRLPPAFHSCLIVCHPPTLLHPLSRLKQQFGPQPRKAIFRLFLASLARRCFGTSSAMARRPSEPTPRPAGLAHRLRAVPASHAAFAPRDARAPSARTIRREGWKPMALRGLAGWLARAHRPSAHRAFCAALSYHGDARERNGRRGARDLRKAPNKRPPRRLNQDI